MQADSTEKKDTVVKVEKQKAGFGQGAFFSGKRKNNSDEAAAKCCSAHCK